MRVLVSGTRGPVTSGIVSELIRRGHSVRLLTANAAEDARRWNRVEPFDAIGGAAGGCDVVVHVGPANLDAMIDEAERESGFRRFAYVAPASDDDAPGDRLERSRLGWTIVRHATVYGPADDTILPLLKLVRTLPVVPVANGDVRVAPLWYEDLARAIVALVERRDTARRTFEIAGSEPLTINELIDRLRNVTSRRLLRLAVPSAAEPIAASVPADALDSPIHLRDLGIDETPLDRGLRMLADSVPEQLLDDGIGKLLHKRFWADIRGSRHSAEALMSIFRERVNDIMPIEFVAEPGAPSKVDLGVALTLSLPMRGHVQVRVERCDPTTVTFATLEGHPIAGMVEFTTRDLPGGVLRFAIDNYSRAGHLLDAIALFTVGEPVQSANWRKVVQNMIDASGGTSDGVEIESRTMSDDAAALIESSLRELVAKRQRTQSAPERSA